MDNNYSTRVALAVRAAMTDKGVSLHALSVDSGISRQTLYRRLDGPVPFTVGQLAVIAEVLGVPVESLAAPEVAA